MEQKLNHKCDICGKEYYFCPDCGNAKSFTPWRTIVDSIEHYKIFLIIKDYTNKYIDVKEAKRLLNNQDLSELDTFRDEIKNVINDILSYEDTVITEKKKKVSKIVNSEIKN